MLELVGMEVGLFPFPVGSRTVKMALVGFSQECMALP